MWRPDWLRGEPLAFVPALVALAMAATSLPARSQTALILSCAGTTLPGQPLPDRDCDQACHVGCTRGKKASGRL